MKKYDNVYSGFLICGDCGSPLFSMSRPDLAPAYTCGTYHSRGTKGCTSHHTRVDMLDSLLKTYVQKVRDNSSQMIEKLSASIKDEKKAVKETETTLEMLDRQIDDARAEMKMLTRQKTKEIMRNPDKEEFYDEMYNEMMDELSDKIAGLKNQAELTRDRRNTVIRVNRVAKTAIQIFDDILNKDKLDKSDLELIIDKIIVYENHIEIILQADIDSLLRIGNFEETAVNFRKDIVDIAKTIVVSAKNRK
ncbi:MAG: recombinase zinc beta ribbon domain-containing protein, partial [Oscillospiraceae bacterium]